MFGAVVWCGWGWAQLMIVSSELMSSPSLSASMLCAPLNWLAVILACQYSSVSGSVLVISQLIGGECQEAGRCWLMRERGLIREVWKETVGSERNVGIKDGADENRFVGFLVLDFDADLVCTGLSAKSVQQPGSAG